MPGLQKFDPFNISDIVPYFGKKYTSGRGSVYIITDTGEFHGSKGKDGREVEALAGIDALDVEEVVMGLRSSPKAFADVIVEFGKRPPKNGYMAVYLKSTTDEYIEPWGLVFQFAKIEDLE